MNTLLTALIRGKKLIIALFAVIPLLLTGTLAHADDDRPRKTLVKKKASKAKTKKVKTVKAKKAKTKVRRTGCYEYDDGRYERDDDCDDRNDRFDRDDD